MTFFDKRSSVVAPIWTSFCFQIYNINNSTLHQILLSTTSNHTHTHTQKKTCKRRDWTPVSTKNTTIPEKISWGSIEGLFFRFGAIPLMIRSVLVWGSFNCSSPPLDYSFTALLLLIQGHYALTSCPPAATRGNCSHKQAPANKAFSVTRHFITGSRASFVL